MIANIYTIPNKDSLVPNFIAATELGISVMELYYRVKRAKLPYFMFVEGKTKQVYYEQNTINDLKKINLIPESTSSKPNFRIDLQPPKYNIGDSVNFYQGRNKFVGNVQLVLPNGDYRVDSAEIGMVELRWFEVNLN